MQDDDKRDKENERFLKVSLVFQKLIKNAIDQIFYCIQRLLKFLLPPLIHTLLHEHR